MSTIRRSTTGCWTCRVRRKKCDENGMPCDICKSLRLTCHGYGARPEWMDGGVQEKEYMAEFKAIVKRSKTRGRRALSSSVSPDTASGSQTSSHPYSEGTSSGVSTTDERSDESGANFNTPMQWLDSIDDIHLHQSTWEFPDMSVRSDRNANENDRIYETLSPNSNECLDHFWSSLTPNTMGNISFEDWANDPLQSPAMNVLHESLQDTMPTSPLENRSPTELLASQGTEKEQQTWKYYTEVLVPSLFQFMPLESSQRECMQALYKCQNSTVCLRDIISQTEQFQAAELKRFGLCSGQKHTSSPQTAQPPKSDEDYSCLDKNCILHILVAQINLGGNEWPNLVDLISNNISALGGTCWQSHFGKELLSFLEVLGSTVTSSPPKLAMSQFTFIDNMANLESVTGVEPWLLGCLIKIIQLRRWKSDQLNKRSLSMSELLRNATTIDNDLRQQRPCPRSGRYPSDHARSAFMNVFEAAAGVFLQCTVAEPRPEIAEIQREVSKTTDALQRLPQAALLKRLGWPICIAASMAIEREQQEFFRNLYERLKTAWGPEENVCRGLEVAFECWRLRESAPAGKTYDWTDGMRSLGSMLLLF